MALGVTSLAGTASATTQSVTVTFDDPTGTYAPGDATEQGVRVTSDDPGLSTVADHVGADGDQEIQLGLFGRTLTVAMADASLFTFDSFLVEGVCASGSNPLAVRGYNSGGSLVAAQTVDPYVFSASGSGVFSFGAPGWINLSRVEIQSSGGCPGNHYFDDITLTVPVALPTQTLSILGGTGAAGSVDASTDWSDDVVAWDAGISTTGAWHFTGNANPVWEPAYLVGGHPWGLVPGTNSWVNCGPTNASAECGNAAGTVVAFRVRFTIPAGSVNPDITFWINSDNAGTYYINGTQVTDRLVGGPGKGGSPLPASAPGIPGVRTAALQSALQAGANEMLVVVEDWGGLAGFNFRADLTVQGTEPPVIVPPTPADTTPPTIVANVAGTLGDNDWYTSDVQVTWTVSDGESAVTSTTGCGATTITTDTAGVTLTCQATSAGGTASSSVTLQRDATAPEATATRTPVANGNGWNNTAVTVSFSGTDNLSGVASCDADAVLGEGAGQSASGTCTDHAGNVSAPASVSDVNVDLTAPVVAVTGVTDGATYTVGAAPSAGCDTSDALSGVASVATASSTGGSVGTVTVVCDGAEDLAGNAGAAVTATYTVAYDFCGFKQPLLAPVQVFKIRSTIPVKFCVQDAAGESIGTAVARVYANGVLQGTARYSLDGEQYIFNLRTQGMSAGPLTIEVRLDDGSAHAIAVALR